MTKKAPLNVRDIMAAIIVICILIGTLYDKGTMDNPAIAIILGYYFARREHILGTKE